MVAKKKTRITLQRIAKKLQVSDFVDYKDYMEALFREMKQRDLAYSYLRYADDLGFGKLNIIRLIIKGDRPMTQKSSLKVIRNLKLTGPDRTYFRAMVNYVNSTDANERDEHFGKMLRSKSAVSPTLDQRQVEYFSNWVNPILRELTSFSEFEPSPEWIKKNLRFPLPIGDIKKALSMLIDLGYVKYDENTGRYSRSSEKIATPFEVDSLGVLSFHQKMIEMGKESMTRVSEEEREVGAVTASLRRSSIPMLRKKIRELLDAMEEEETAEEGEEIYQLNVQLFPFTKLNKG